MIIKEGDCFIEKDNNGSDAFIFVIYHMDGAMILFDDMSDMRRYDNWVIKLPNGRINNKVGDSFSPKLSEYLGNCND